jgi:hypothetical protein
LNSPPGLKVGTATFIDPNPPTVITPAVALAARGVAALLHQLHSPASIGGAVMPTHVVGRARYDRASATPVPVIPITVSIPVPVSTPTAFYNEISPAAVVDPETPAIGAPAIPLPAGRFAALPIEPNPASSA